MQGLIVDIKYVGPKRISGYIHMGGPTTAVYPMSSFDVMTTARPTVHPRFPTANGQMWNHPRERLTTVHLRHETLPRVTDDTPSLACTGDAYRRSIH